MTTRPKTTKRATKRATTKKTTKSTSPSPKTATKDEDYYCAHCGGRNTNLLDVTKSKTSGSLFECYDCGKAYIPVKRGARLASEHEYAFDAKLDVVVRVLAKSKEEARAKIALLECIDIGYDNDDSWITEGTVILKSLNCFAVDGQLLAEKEEPPSHDEPFESVETLETRQERLKKGPQPGQTRAQLLHDLSLATDELQKAGSFGGGMLWSGVVAAYEKALGYPVTPKVRIGEREFDLSTVNFTVNGFSVKLKEEKNK